MTIDELLVITRLNGFEEMYGSRWWNDLPIQHRSRIERPLFLFSSDPLMPCVHIPICEYDGELCMIDYPWNEDYLHCLNSMLSINIPVRIMHDYR